MIPTRRRMLQDLGLCAAALAAACVRPPDSEGASLVGGDSSTPEDSGTTGALEDTAGADTGAADTGASVAYTPDESAWDDPPNDCAEATIRRNKGPFYREGIPERNLLNVHDEQGQVYRIFFRVVDHACTPIEGARVEVWHCAPESVYDMTSVSYRFYGAILTDAEGRGWFQSLVPPPYLDAVGLMRPHIHYWLVAEGFLALETQTKFAFDPEVGEDPSLDHILEFTEAADGALEARRLFVLEPDVGEAGA